jgi:hypothetical protein
MANGQTGGFLNLFKDAPQAVGPEPPQTDEERGAAFRRALESGDRQAVNQHIAGGTPQLLTSPQAIKEMRALLDVYRDFPDNAIQRFGAARLAEMGLPGAGGFKTEPPKPFEGKETKPLSATEFAKQQRLGEVGVKQFLEETGVIKPKKEEPLPEGGSGVISQRGKAGFGAELTEKGELVRVEKKSKESLALEKRRLDLAEKRIRNAANRIALEQKKFERKGKAGESPSVSRIITGQALKIAQDATLGEPVFTLDELFERAKDIESRIRKQAGLEKTKVAPQPKQQLIPIDRETALEIWREAGGDKARAEELARKRGFDF